MTIEPRNFDDLIVVARRHRAALVIALRAGDATAQVVAATKLRKALNRAVSVAFTEPFEATLPRFYEATGEMLELLRSVPAGKPDPQKLARWAAERKRVPAELEGPHLFELDTQNVELADSEFLGVYVSHSRLIVDLQRSRFRNATFDRCDFTYGGLRETKWRETCVRRSFLRDCDLGDAAFERVTFRGCDLRDADLSVHAGAGNGETSDLHFFHCDLRGANLSGRNLSWVQADDCKVHGVTGVERSRPLTVYRADLSPEGDGSQMIGLDDVGTYVSERAPVLSLCLPASANGSVIARRGGGW
jgi:uncharacterized protein YjbI with pentapeptide repeats